MSDTSSGDFRKAAEAIVDAATVGLSFDGNVSLHPSLRAFLVDEVIINPLITSKLFKDNFLEQFLQGIVENDDIK